MIIRLAGLVLAGLLLPVIAMAGLAPNPSTSPLPSSTGQGVTLSVSSTSSNVALPDQTGVFQTVWVCNIGSTEAFVGWGLGSSITVTTSGISVPANLCMPFWVGDANYFAGITASSTTTLRISQWQGSPGVARLDNGGGGSGVTSVIAGSGLTGGGSGPGAVTVSLGAPVPVNLGGTNATSAGATAANNIGALAQSNNLSDLANASMARTNLGLGTGAVANTGTSGSTLPLNNGGFTQSGTANFTGSFQINGTPQTFPGSGLLVGTTDTQTLSGKTLTSPTINGGALAGTLTGSPTLSGNPAFTGSPTFSNLPSLPCPSTDIPIGNVSGIMVCQAVTGDGTFSAAGVLTVTGSNGTQFGNAAFQPTTAFLSSAGGTLSGVLTNEAGACPNPAMTFGDSATGFYKLGTNSIGYCANGVAAWDTNSNGAVILNDGFQVTGGLLSDNLSSVIINGTQAAVPSSSNSSARALSITETFEPGNSNVNAVIGGFISPKLDVSAATVPNLEDFLGQLTVNVGYTLTSPNLTFYEAQNVTWNSTSPQAGNLIAFLSDSHFLTGGWGNGITSGTAQQIGFRDVGGAGGAGTGATLANIGAYLTLGSGNTSTTSNIGLQIDGNGGASAGHNWAVKSTSTADSEFLGGIDFTTIGGVSPSVLTCTYCSANIVFQTKGTATGTISTGLLSITGVLATVPNLGATNSGILYLSAADGAVCQGSGTSYDCSFEDNAGAVAMGVLHGTTNVAFLGVVGLTQATWADNQTCITGQISVDASYIYECTATNTVKRAALSTF